MGADVQVFALTSQANPQQIGRIAGTTIHAAPFFQRSCVVQISPTEVALLDSVYVIWPSRTGGADEADESAYSSSLPRQTLHR